MVGTAEVTSRSRSSDPWEHHGRTGESRSSLALLEQAVQRPGMMGVLGSCPRSKDIDRLIRFSFGRILVAGVLAMNFPFVAKIQ